jgi:hypothetical protein
MMLILVEMTIMTILALASRTMRLAVNVFLLYKKQIEGKFVVGQWLLDVDDMVQVWSAQSVN